MNIPGMSFRDVDWSFVDRVEKADYRTNAVTVIFKSGNQFRVVIPRELFMGIWQGGEERVLEQNARLHDDNVLNDGELH